MKLTQSITREFIRRLGGTFRRDSAGDFRVSFNGSTYFAADLADAIGTARAMAGSHPNIESAEQFLAEQNGPHGASCGCLACMRKQSQPDYWGI